MHVSKFLRTARLGFVSAITFSIMACGGGGGDSSSERPPAPPPPDTLSLSINTPSVDMSEASSSNVTFDVTYSGSKPLSYEVTLDGVSNLSASVSGKEISLTVGDVTEFTNEATVSIKVTDGAVSDTETLSVNVENTSFLVTLNELVNTSTALSSFASTDTSATNAVIFLTDIDVKTGLFPMDSLDTEIKRRTDSVAAANEALSLFGQALLDTLNAYPNEKTGNESELEAHTQSLQDEMSNYVSAINAAYSDVRSTKNGTLPTINFTTLTPLDTGYSLFVGNENMGTFTGDEWSFATPYAFLAPVINSNVCYSL